MNTLTADPSQDPHQDPPENPSVDLEAGDSFYYGFRPCAGVYDVARVEGAVYVATNPALKGWEIRIPRNLVVQFTRPDAV